MIAAILIFLAWGSYLNSLGYRLLHLNDFFKTRSFCPACKHQIAWHDNIPVLSWLWLYAQCRSCKQSISWLYPFIELITLFFLLLAWHNIEPTYFPTYFLFFSALIVTIRTDFDQMLISRFVTIYLIPIAFFTTLYGKLPIHFTTSVIGSLFGYFLLWSVKKINLWITHQDGLGQGDVELLAFIGAFIGPLGCWISLVIGSIMGTIITLLCMLLTQSKISKIPFGSYLAFGAILFTLFQDIFINSLNI